VGGLLETLPFTGVDVMSLDWTVHTVEGKKRLGTDIKAGNGKHILNLGHGIEVGTPEENVAYFLRLLKDLGKPQHGYAHASVHTQPIRSIYYTELSDLHATLRVMISTKSTVRFLPSIAKLAGDITPIGPHPNDTQACRTPLTFDLISFVVKATPIHSRPKPYHGKIKATNALAIIQEHVAHKAHRAHNSAAMIPLKHILSRDKSKTIKKTIEHPGLCSAYALANSFVPPEETMSPSAESSYSFSALSYRTKWGTQGVHTRSLTLNKVSLSALFSILDGHQEKSLTFLVSNPGTNNLSFHPP
ncbi:uroporphyrinogen decarboxylase, partial [Tanacetum coccineum]